MGVIVPVVYMGWYFGGMGGVVFLLVSERERG